MFNKDQGTYYCRSLLIMKTITSLWRFLFIIISWTYLTMANEHHSSTTVHNWPNVVRNTNADPSGRSFFSSKLDYNNKWLPVGRGDPLKNDPTYDYSPPVEHRVRFWDDRKQNGNKNEILLLGVSSKRPYNQKVEPTHSHTIPTVMLPPPIQTPQVLTYKDENNLIRQSNFAIHNTWPDKLTDSQPGESNSYASIVKPNKPTTKQQAGEIAFPSNKFPIYQSSHQPNNKSVKKSWLQDLLQKEVTKPSPSSNVQMESVPIFKLNDFQQHYTRSIIESTTPYFVPTIQPSYNDKKPVMFTEPKRVMQPMHLIIQGHSRVKTYGQGTAERDPKIIEVKSAEDPVINRVVSEDENGVKFDVKHLHTDGKTKPDSELESKNNNSTMAGLLSLLDLSFGDFLDNTSEVVNETKFNEIKVL